MSYILDILAIIIILWAVMTGYKKGFVKTILKLCSGIICLILAISFAPPLGNYINENFISPIYEDIIEERFENIAPAENGEDPDINKLVEEEPNEFVQLLDKYNIDISSFKEFFNSFTEEKKEETADLAIEYVAKPISETISYVIAFVVILVVSSLLMMILTFILDKIVKLPLLRTANKLLGFVCGIFFGTLWVYVLATIVEYTIPYMSASSSPLISQIAPEKTLVFQYFYYNNPISEFIKALF
ncbi:MAG: CvpA family protein [Clostridia bacterium]|nr:CvpA family protein [Clostridia bacterium]